MNKLLIALIAGTFAATVGAQGTMPGETPKDKAKQNTVESATKAGTDTGERKSVEQKGVAEAKASKGTPKDLPTKADKQKAVDASTASACRSSASPFVYRVSVAQACARVGSTGAGRLPRRCRLASPRQ